MRPIGQIIDDVLTSVVHWVSRKSEHVQLTLICGFSLFLMFSPLFIAASRLPATNMVSLLAIIIVLSGMVRNSWKYKLAVYGMDREELSKIQWQDFELFMEVFFQLEGYDVTRRGGSKPDGGIDLLISKNGKRTAVQCKHWLYSDVGVKVIRETLGAMTLEAADMALVATTGSFTSESRKIAEQCRDLTLLDGSEIAVRMKDHEERIKTQGFEEFKRDGLSGLMARVLDEVQRSGEYIPVRRCRKCNDRMLLKYSEKNRDYFWGCRRWPQCPGDTRPLEGIEREVLAKVI